MRKITILMVGIIYVASIFIIAFFGMKAKVFDEVVKVTEIECVNESDDKVTVSESGGKKYLRVNFTTEGKLNDNGVPVGTYLYIELRVYPDNATNKDITFIYDQNNPPSGVTSVKDENGKEMQILLFERPVTFLLGIKSVDGTNVSEEIWVVVR